jgi:hypothetical protein
MATLSTPQKPLTLRTLSPWFVLATLVIVAGACVLGLMALWSAIEGPVRQYPNANALWPQFSGYTSQVSPCSTLHLGMISNAVTPDTPDRVMTWYRAARMDYANQGGDPRRYHVRYANGPFRLEYQRTPSVFILTHQTQISIATSLDLRWCP